MSFIKMPFVVCLFIPFVKILSMTVTLCLVSLVGLLIRSTSLDYTWCQEKSVVPAWFSFVRISPHWTNVLFDRILPNICSIFSQKVSTLDAGLRYIQLIVAFCVLFLVSLKHIQIYNLLLRICFGLSNS